MKGQFQVGYVLAFRDAQRVQPGLLVPALTVGGDELDDPDLLAFVFGGATVGLDGRLGANPHFADLGEVVPNRRVRHILEIVAIHSGQRIEIAAPLFRNRVGVHEVGFVEVFDVGGVATVDVRAPPEELHLAFLHVKEIPRLVR